MLMIFNLTLLAPKFSTGWDTTLSTGGLTMEDFSTEFEKLGTKLLSVTSSVGRGGRDIRDEPCVLIASTTVNYSWAKGFADRRTSQDAPYILFEVAMIRKGQLAKYWARLPALLATLRVLTKARFLVYTDVDTVVNWPFVCELGNRTEKAMTISYKIWPPRTQTREPEVHIRTNWFVLRTAHPVTEYLLYSWYYKGRNVALQDQRILNEIWHNESWAKEVINILPVGKHPVRRTELLQCGSWLKPKKRAKCLRIS